MKILIRWSQNEALEIKELVETYELDDIQDELLHRIAQEDKRREEAAIKRLQDEEEAKWINKIPFNFSIPIEYRIWEKQWWRSKEEKEKLELEQLRERKNEAEDEFRHLKHQVRRAWAWSNEDDIDDFFERYYLEEVDDFHPDFQEEDVQFPIGPEEDFPVEIIDDPNAPEGDPAKDFPM